MEHHEEAFEKWNKQTHVSATKASAVKSRTALFEIQIRETDATVIFEDVLCARFAQNNPQVVLVILGLAINSRFARFV